MKIALIRQRYNPFGGAEGFVERAIGALSGDGVDVTLITRAWRHHDSRRILKVDPFYAGRLWRDFSFSKEVRKVLATEHFDLVQSHERIPGCDAYRAGDGVHRQWLDNRLKSASLLERLGIALNPYHHYVCAVEREMFEHPRLRAVICNSRMVAAEIKAHFAIRPEKIHVIYSGVDLEFFHPDRRMAMRAQSRREFGLSAEDVVFSFVGSGFARKGLGAAIESLARSGKSDMKLLVAGHDRASARFAERAARAGLADRVILLGGRKDVFSVLAASDCFILPTRYDPFPNAVLEAMASGIPAIVSNQCGAAELIVEGRNGWVCESDAVDSIARAMTEAAVGGGERGVEARRTAEGYGLGKMAADMAHLYRDLLGWEKEGSIER